ncbi:MAG: carboxypeptidase-like regulatory domain-containing protein [bacterium]|nr:carboxypeptidase-like regulatory domain-containing protein [bacterium]
MKINKRKRSKVALRTLVLMAIVMAITGCNNNAGIDNGIITGELKMVGGGPLPAITIRAEGLTAGSTSPGQLSRYTTVQGMDGHYTIPNCKVGVYNVTYYIPQFSQGYLYKISLRDGNPSSGGGGGEVEPVSRVSQKKISPKQGNYTIDAYVESGQSYIMPTIYLEKEAASGIGVLTGHVYNAKGRNIAVAGATVTVDSSASWTDVTDETGSFTIAGITAGKSYPISVTAPGYTAPETAVQASVGIGQTVTQDLYIEPMLAAIRGNISVEGKFSSYITWDQMVQLTVSGKGSAWDEQIQITGNGWFDIAVPAFLPGYEVTVVALEPLFNESSTVLVPKLTPNQIYRVPDGDLVLSINHKSVTVMIKPPVGESPVSGTFINVKASGGGNTINTVEARPGSTSYTCRIDVPYGMISFITIGATAANAAWAEASELTYDVNENFSQIVYLLLGGGTAGTGTTP